MGFSKGEAADQAVAEGAAEEGAEVEVGVLRKGGLGGVAQRVSGLGSGHASFGLRYLFANLGSLTPRAKLLEFEVSQRTRLDESRCHSACSFPERSACRLGTQLLLDLASQPAS